MNGLAEDVFAVDGARDGERQETGVAKANASHHASLFGSADEAEAGIPDLRWLGLVSCMCSAVITLAGAALIGGQLLSTGAGDMVAEEDGALPDYAVAAGSDYWPSPPETEGIPVLDWATPEGGY